MVQPELGYTGSSQIRWGWHWRRDGLGVGVEVPDDQERPRNLIGLEDLDVVQRYGVR